MGDLVPLSAALQPVFTSPWPLAAIVAKFVLYVSSFAAVGIMLAPFALRSGIDAGITARLHRLAFLAIVVSILATMVRILVQAGRLMDDGIEGMLDPEIILIGLEGPLGTSSAVRAIGIIGLLLGLILPFMRLPLTILGSVLVALSFALIGHATKEPQWLMGGLITFHLLAISYWFGVLFPLHMLSHPDRDPGVAARTSERFGRQASVLVPLLIIAGGFFAYLLLGDLFRLFTTNYGLVLLAKLGLVIIILGFAAMNKLRFVPALAKAGVGSAKAFRSSLRYEGMAFICVFAATALLTTLFGM